MRPARLAPLWAMVAVFALPPLGAALWYAHASVHGSDARARGQLIAPPRPVSLVRWTSPDGRALTPDALRGRWTLLYRAERCDTECGATLRALERVRLALGRNAARVRVLAALEAAPAGTPAAAIAIAPADGAVDAETTARASLWLVDPEGQAMMAYDAGAPPGDVYRDLKRLLAASHRG